MDALDAFSTVTVGQLRRIRDATSGVTSSETDSASISHPQTPGEGPLIERLGQATAAKLVGLAHEPVLLGDYELERLVGIGGLGQVFAAHSIATGRRVALKILRRSSVGALLGLKREFRALAEVEHPNLVGLDSLVVAPDADAFFTMELVSGVPFVEYVRGRLRRHRPPNEARLRRALLQLVSAVDHLHARGYVHRDLKPSNVLVTDDGRVVVLDFGLVDELERAGELVDEELLGTPAYMAPEQVEFGSVGPPADLYAIGTMLFESLCGVRPFVGNLNQMLIAKLDQPARDPAKLVPGCDPELLSLCRELLARDPARRPGAKAVIERLRHASSSVSVPLSASVPHAASTRGVPFIGRDAELAALDGALLDLHTQGRAIVSLISGPSGQGKSSLLSRWRASLDGDELVLRGRCLERESIAYKGLDAVIDALSDHLARLPAAALEALRPAAVAELVRLFPVLATVWPNTEPPAGGLEPVERRERAVSGLRELLSRLARVRTVVIMLDDFHWADTDSSALLGQLLDSVVGPRLSLVVGYREPPDPGPALARLRAMRDSPYIELRELELGPLADAEAHELLAALLADAPGELPAAAAAILREGAGNPSNLRELVRGHGDVDELDLDRLIVRRILGLTPARRQVLAFVAMAEGPLERAALSAAGSNEADIEALIVDEILCVSELDAEQVEVGQERIAELAIAELDANDLPRYHLRLAAALTSIAASPELLAKHYERGGQRGQAFIYARQAATQAMDALAFRRAAMWLERCLAWLPSGDDGPRLRRELELQLVTAYVNFGRLVAGAELLLAQAKEPGVDDARDLRIRAVEYLITAGHMQDGLREAEELLSAVGLDMPRGNLRMLLNVLSFRRQLARDLARFDAKPEPRRDPMLLERARVCKVLAESFISHDGLVSLHFNILRRGLAIDMGDHGALANALSVDAVFCSSAGWHQQITDLLERARALDGRGYRAKLWLSVTEIHIGMNSGEFRHAIELFNALLPEFEAHADLRWERQLAIAGAAGALVMAGHYRSSISNGRRDMQLATELGDLKQVRDHAGMLAWALVCVGELDEAGQVIATVERLEHGVIDGRYLFADLFRDLARIRWLLRTQAAEPALAAARLLPAKLKRDGLWHVVSFRLEGLSALACAELQVWWRAPSRSGRRRLRKLARQLAKGSEYHRGNAAIIEASLHQVGGDRAAAVAKLSEAEACFVSVGAEAHLAAVRIRRAALSADDEAEQLRAAAEAYFLREHVHEPEGLAMVFAPGDWV